MLRLTTIKPHEYVPIIGSYVGLNDYTPLTNFYADKRLWCVRLRNEPIAVFCINEGPTFRTLETMSSPQKISARLGSVDDRVEVIGFGIEPRFRKTLVGYLCWMLMIRELLRSPRSRVLFFAVEPRLAAMYESVGLRPVLTEFINYDHGGRHASVYVVERHQAPWYFARHLYNRLVRRVKATGAVEGHAEMASSAREAAPSRSRRA